MESTLKGIPELEHKKSNFAFTGRFIPGIKLPHYV
jgi:hypothetical protein